MNRQNTLRLIAVLFLTAFVQSYVASYSFAQSDSSLRKQTTLDDQTSTLLSNGGYIISKNGKVIKSFHQDKLFIPASIWKITTAAAALHILGPSYRFKTEFYYANNTLFIKGYGDPFLVSEEIKKIAVMLLQKGIGPIGEIIIDNTFFNNPGETEGSSRSHNPYDAVNTALAVNFNTINLAKKNGGSTHSAEAETPYLPIMTKLASDLKIGKHRVGLYRQDESPLLYAGQLFYAMLNSGKHPPLSPKISEGSVPNDLVPVYSHYSTRTVSGILSELFLYSNNFIANQIYLTCGAQTFGEPATWEKAQLAINSFLTNELIIDSSTFFNQEGSGLSRKNKVTLKTMVTILEHFKPFAKLLPQEYGIRVKSGTLKGVYAYAGYFGTLRGPDPFVIILNQPKNTRDKLLRLLHNYYQLQK